MIQLFITGGTLDKQYDERSGELVFPASHLPELLQEANLTLPIKTNLLMQKDSLDMTLADRDVIEQACLNVSNHQIVITHGTDTMVDTALHLSRNALLQDKTIVLTGAMRPFKLGASDAPFNVGSAIMAVQLAPKGVWIVMNGQLFNAHQVNKNRQLGQFEPV